MSFNKSSLAFDDIKAIFEKAYQSKKGVRIPCTSRQQAINLRSRFNYFRAMDRRENSQVYDKADPMWGKSVYDKLALRIPPKYSPDEHMLYIEPHLATDFDVEEIS